MKLAGKIVLLCVLAGAFSALTFANRSPSVEPKRSVLPENRRVKVAAVEEIEAVRQIRLSGETRAVNRVKLSFTLGERVVARLVEVGDHVSAGDVVARLDDGRIVNAIAEVEASLRETEARINQINRDQKRVESLVAANASAAVELERTVEKSAVLLAAKAANEAKLAEARRLLKESVLVAPFPATITEVFIEPGEFAAPGSPVAMLSGDGPVEIEVEVPESVVSRLAVGMPVKIDLPLSGRKGLDGTVAYLGRTALGKGRLFPVQIAVSPASDVVAGMTVEVIFRAKSSSFPSVPLACIVNPGGQTPQLFKVENGAARKIPVEIGQILEDRVTVKGNVRSGDLVVSGGHLALLDGEAVTVVHDEHR